MELLSPHPPLSAPLEPARRPRHHAVEPAYTELEEARLRLAMMGDAADVHAAMAVGRGRAEEARSARAQKEQLAAVKELVGELRKGLKEERAAKLAREEELQLALAAARGEVEEERSRALEEHEKRTDALRKKVLRRLVHRGLSRGFGAWAEVHEQAAKQRRQLAGVVARLARPRVVACMVAWRNDWEEARRKAAEDASSAALAAERERRVAHIQQMAMRRMAQQGLSRGFGAWAEAASEAKRRESLLRAAAGRLARPQLAACVAAWRKSWQAAALSSWQAKQLAKQESARLAAEEAAARAVAEAEARVAEAEAAARSAEAGAEARAAVADQERLELERAAEEARQAREAADAKAEERSRLERRLGELERAREAREVEKRVARAWHDGGMWGRAAQLEERTAELSRRMARLGRVGGVGGVHSVGLRAAMMDGAGGDDDGGGELDEEEGGGVAALTARMDALEAEVEERTEEMRRVREEEATRDRAAVERLEQELRTERETATEQRRALEEALAARQADVAKLTKAVEELEGASEAEAARVAARDAAHNAAAAEAARAAEAALAAERERRVAHIQQMAMRRMAQQGLSRGFGAWAEAASEAKRRESLLRGAAARLSRPQLAACVAAWRRDWEAARLQAVEAAMAASAAEATAAAASPLAALQRAEGEAARARSALEALEAESRATHGALQLKLERQTAARLKQLGELWTAQRRREALTRRWRRWADGARLRKKKMGMMRAAAARLARPQLAACVAAWRRDWDVTRRLGSEQELRRGVEADAAARFERAAKEAAEKAERLAKKMAAEKAALEAEVARLMLQLSGDKAASERRAAEAREGHVERVRQRAARRLLRQGLSRGFGAWAEVYQHEAKQRRQLAGVVARLARPRVVACMVAWRNDWEAERKREAEDASSAALAAERERRVAHVQQMAMRRMAQQGLSRGFGAWAEAAKTARRREGLLRGVAARLLRPQLAASVSAWRRSWEVAELSRKMAQARAASADEGRRAEAAAARAVEEAEARARMEVAEAEARAEARVAEAEAARVGAKRLQEAAQAAATAAAADAIAADAKAARAVEEQRRAWEAAEEHRRCRAEAEAAAEAARAEQAEAAAEAARQITAAREAARRQVAEARQAEIGALRGAVEARREMSALAEAAEAAERAAARAKAAAAREVTRAEERAEQATKEGVAAERGRLEEEHAREAAEQRAAADEQRRRLDEVLAAHTAEGAAKQEELVKRLEAVEALLRHTQEEIRKPPPLPPPPLPSPRALAMQEKARKDREDDRRAARQVARTLEGVPNAFEPLSSPATSRHASEGRLATESAM